MASVTHAVETTVRPKRGRQWVRLFAKLTKAGLNFMVVITTAVGFVLANPERIDWLLLAWTLLGTGLSALGASGMNQWLEWRRDALMERTKNRPIPGRQLTPEAALLISLALCVAGVLLLAWQVNMLTALLAFSVQFVYIVLYTPLKTRSPLCTLVGAYCGAVPPMMGFTAVTGSLGLGAYILGALLFAWQIPHFLALAWLYREDYARGGHQMLPVVDERGRVTLLMVVLYALALVPISLALTLAGEAGWFFAAGAIALGFGLVALGLLMMASPTRLTARRVFLGSIAYLPAVMLLLVLDAGPWGAPHGGEHLRAAPLVQEAQPVPALHPAAAVAYPAAQEQS